MNKIFSLEQLIKTGNLDSNLLLQQYEIDIMLRFIEIKSRNVKRTQKQTAEDSGISDFTIERYRKGSNTASSCNKNKNKRTTR